MFLTVQIVNFNSRNNLRECLQSIKDNFSDWENLQIIVINNDKEKMGNFLNDFGAELIEKNENIGFGKAHNLALTKAQGDYILFLNPDTKVFPGAFENLLDTFSLDEKIGIAGPIYIGQKNTSEEEHYGPEKTPLSTIGRKISRRKNEPKPSDIFETDWVSGGAMMIRKNLFLELGGFDENYFLYFEDVDLCLQARKKGWKVVIHSKAKIFHKSGQSFSDNRVKKKHYYQSQSHYIKKNFGSFWAVVLKVLQLPFYIRNVYCRK